MLLERIEAWYERIGRKIVYILLWLAGIYVFFKYIFGLVLPFIVAWGFACLLNPIVTWLNKRAKLPRAVGTLASMATILSGLIGVVTLIVRQLWLQIQGFTASFDIYKAELMSVIARIENSLQNLGDRVPLPSAFSSLDDLIGEAMGYISGFLDEIVKGTYAILTQLPNGLFLIIVTFIAVFFMTKDFRKIKNFVKAQIPERTTNKIVVMQQGLKSALGGYVKTQLILMCFTFAICLVGLFVLSRQYALLMALGIALLDALPVFGSGAILIPWGIYHLIMGNYAIGVGLLAIYGLIVVMRQIMEPKVLSTQIGVYALITVMAMYIGLKALGILGMILGPVIVVIFMTLQRTGIIPPFKEPKSDHEHK